jgi:hypothetical protein
VSGLLVADRRQATGRRVHTLHHGQERAQPTGTRMAAARVVRRLAVPQWRPMPVGTRWADQQKCARKQVSEHCHKQQHDGEGQGEAHRRHPGLLCLLVI